MNQLFKISVDIEASPCMNGIMAERIRIIIDTDEEVRLAVRLAATKADLTTSELINTILRKALASEIEDARKYTPKKRKEKGE